MGAGEADHVILRGTKRLSVILSEAKRSRKIFFLVDPAFSRPGRSFDSACGLAQDDTGVGVILNEAPFCHLERSEAESKDLIFQIHELFRSFDSACGLARP